MTDITSEAVARREAARQNGRFGEQERTAPEAALASGPYFASREDAASQIVFPVADDETKESRYDVAGVHERVVVHIGDGSFWLAEDEVGDALAEFDHTTEILEGGTRNMPANTDDNAWYEGPLLDRASEIAERHGVIGSVTRDALPEGTSEPYARYTAALHSTRAGEVPYPFTYETGNQKFELATPTVAEVLADAACQANIEHGATTEAGDATALDRLIALVGERDARELLAESYVQSGQLAS